MKIIKALLALALLFLPANFCLAQTINYQESSEVERIFSAAGASGTFILYDVQEDTFIGYNLARAQTRYNLLQHLRSPTALSCSHWVSLKM